MEVLHGNLITLAKNGRFDIIVHGCNCFNKMGSGIAKQIKKNFPVAHYVDQETRAGDITKLGTISVGAQLVEHNLLYIVNAYTQYNYGWQRKQYVNYTALRSCFKKVADMAEDLVVGYPLIGADRGGGDWNIIKDIIDEELTEVEHYLVMLT